MKPSLFNTTLPIIQAPMAGVQNEQLALVVSEAGGLGSLPCAMLSPAQLVEQLEILSHKTTKPFNLNFFVMQLLTTHPRNNSAGMHYLPLTLQSIKLTRKA